jgi:uncharacterized protein
MSVLTRNRVTAKSGALAILILFVLSGVARTGALQPRAPERAGNEAHNPRGKLIFMLTTGREDIREVRLCLENLKTARASGYLEDAIWIVEGRGVEALGSVEGLSRPPELVQLAREVKASGVHLIASSSSLEQYRISTAGLDPKPDELVPDPALRMAEMVSQGYQVIRY